MRRVLGFALLMPIMFALELSGRGEERPVEQAEGPAVAWVGGAAVERPGPRGCSG